MMVEEELSKELEERARKELGETPEEKEKKIEELRQLVADDVKCNRRTDDQFLIRFLRSREYDVKKAYSVVKEYYKMHHDLPELLNDDIVATLKPVFELQTHHLLPYRDKNNRFIYIGRMGSWDPEKCTIRELFCAGWTMLEHGLSSHEAQICGVVTITDCQGLSLSYLRHTGIADAKRLIAIAGDAFPMRLFECHYINSNSAFKFIFRMCKHLIGQQIREKIHIHTGKTIDPVFDSVGKENLPEDFGGLRPKLDNSEFYKSVLHKVSPLVTSSNGTGPHVQENGANNCVKNHASP